MVKQPVHINCVVFLAEIRYALFACPCGVNCHEQWDVEVPNFRQDQHTKLIITSYRLD